MNKNSVNQTAVKGPVSVNSAKLGLANKRGEYMLMFGALIGLLFAANGLLPQQDETISKKSIAKVNGYELSIDEYQALLKKISDIVPVGVMPIEQQQQKLLDSMIDEHLLAQQAIALQLTLSDSRLRKMLAMSITEWQTTEALSEVVDDKTLKAFYANNSALFQGSDLLQVQQMRFRCTDKHCSEQSTTYKTAQNALKQLGQGGYFNEVKQQFAEPDFIALAAAPLSRKELHHKLGKTLALQANLLSQGQHSELIISDNYYHILKVVKREPTAIVTFEQVSEQVLKAYQQQKRLQQMDDYLDGLKRDADIIIHAQYFPTKAQTSIAQSSKMNTEKSSTGVSE